MRFLPASLPRGTGRLPGRRGQADRQLEPGRETAEVASPHSPKHRTGRGRAERSAHPPSEPERLSPLEPCMGLAGGSRASSEPELPGARNRPAVTDPHDLAVLPLGDLHAIDGPHRADSGSALEAHANALGRLGEEAKSSRRRSSSQRGGRCGAGPPTPPRAPRAPPSKPGPSPRAEPTAAPRTRTMNRTRPHPEPERMNRTRPHPEPERLTEPGRIPNPSHQPSPAAPRTRTVNRARPRRRALIAAPGDERPHG